MSTDSQQKKNANEVRIQLTTATGLFNENEKKPQYYKGQWFKLYCIIFNSSK